MSTAEQLFVKARTLPLEEQQWLRDALDRELQPASTHTTHEREQEWIEQHRDEYQNQWVALDGDKLLAHGTNAREVYLAAQVAGVTVPYIERVKSGDRPPFGGW